MSTTVTTERFISDRDRVLEAAAEMRDGLLGLSPEERRETLAALKENGGGGHALGVRTNREAAQAFSAREGVDPEREALNDRVNDYFEKHPDATMTEAIAFAAPPITDGRGHEVRNVQGAPAHMTDDGRQAMSDKLDAYMKAHPEASVAEAIRAIEAGQS